MTDKFSFLEGLPIVLVAVTILIAITMYLAINGLICYLTIKSLSPIPPEHRKIEPASVWLLLIPCFNLIWNFVVFQRIPESFQSCFAGQGRTDVGDCGKSLGLWYAVSNLLVFIPMFGYIAWIATIVLLILTLVRFNELKNKLPPKAPLVSL